MGRTAARLGETAMARVVETQSTISASNAFFRRAKILAGIVEYSTGGTQATQASQQRLLSIWLTSIRGRLVPGTRRNPRGKTALFRRRDSTVGSDLPTSCHSWPARR